MYVPIMLDKPATALAPAGILSATPAAGAAANTAIVVRRSHLNVLAGQTATVAGALRPGLPGRLVMLQTLGRHGWSTVSRARTRARGYFQLRYVSSRVGHVRARVRFAGDSVDLGAHRRLGWLNVNRVEAGSGKAMCVAERESSLRWHLSDPPYSGAFQFTDETWVAAGGGRYSSTAAAATPTEQVEVFLAYEPSHPGAWPVTVPACS